MNDTKTKGIPLPSGPFESPNDIPSPLRGMILNPANLKKGGASHIRAEVLSDGRIEILYHCAESKPLFNQDALKELPVDDETVDFLIGKARRDIERGVMLALLAK